MNKVNLAYLNFTLSGVLNVLDSAPRDDPEQATRARAMRDVWNVFERIAEEFSISLSFEHPNWHEIDDETFGRYLRKAFDEIRRIAADAEWEAMRSRTGDDADASYDPYVSELLFVLSIMQTNVRSLGLDGRLVDLDTFNPTLDLGKPTRSDLAPYRSR